MRNQEIPVPIGSVFTRLTVVEKIKPGIYRCLCSCGNYTEVTGRSLRRTCNNAGSCGCLKKDRIAAACTTHGLSETAEFNIWCDMRKRCTNPNANNYHNYGGRGISVCERWLTAFANFLEDVGKRPSKLYSLDRINNDGNYEPSNVKWSTKEEQGINRRTTVCSAEMAAAIRAARVEGTLTNKELASKYRISVASVSHIITNRTWRVQEVA